MQEVRFVRQTQVKSGLIAVCSILTRFKEPNVITFKSLFAPSSLYTAFSSKFKSATVHRATNVWKDGNKQLKISHWSYKTKQEGR